MPANLDDLVKNYFKSRSMSLIFDLVMVSDNAQTVPYLKVI